MGTGSFPGVKRPGCGADHPPLLVSRSRKSRAIPLLPLCAFGAYYRVHFTFYIIIRYTWAGYVSRYRDWLRTGRSGDRIPVGARFFAQVQNGPGDHPASYTMGTGSFPGVKRPVRDADHPPPPSAEVENK
jgi:hypothetical protein